MGNFSWIDCKDKTRIKINQKAFLLIPAEFGGGCLTTEYYNGYGIFGGLDVYELVAEWNREKITENMIKNFIQEPKKSQFGGLYGFEKRELEKQGKTADEIEKLEAEQRTASYNRALKRYNNTVAMIKDYIAGVDDDEMAEKYGDEYKREIGIYLACEDENNKRLAYPIKVTHDATAIYEKCKYSKTDIYQGCD